MAARIAKIILLVEDQATERLLYHYLKRLRPDHSIRVVRISDGRGSSEQFVREHYATQVRAVRTATTRACLIVAIDADKETTFKRKQQFEQALREANEPASTMTV